MGHAGNLSLGWAAAVWPGGLLRSTQARSTQLLGVQAVHTAVEQAPAEHNCEAAVTSSCSTPETPETTPLVGESASSAVEAAEDSPSSSREKKTGPLLPDAFRNELAVVENWLPSGWTMMRLGHAAKVLLVVTIYTTVGPALIVVNKWILNDIGFRYPTAVASIGQISSSIYSFACFRVFNTHSLKMQHKVSWRFFLGNMGAVGAASAASIAFGQHSYLFLSVSFIQMLKSLTPVITSMMLVLLGIEHPSPRIWGCVICITTGAVIASLGEIHFVAFGVLLAFLASLTEGLRLVLTQKLLINLKFPAMEGLYYFSPITTLWMILGAFVIDLPVFLEDERSAHEMLQEILTNSTSPSASEEAMLLQKRAPTALITEHWRMFAACALLGLAVNISSMLMIKYTGSVSLKLLAMARNAALVLYAVTFEGELTTDTQIFGYTVCIVFFAVYIVEKSKSLDSMSLPAVKVDTTSAEEDGHSHVHRRHSTS